MLGTQKRLEKSAIDIDNWKKYVHNPKYLVKFVQCGCLFIPLKGLMYPKKM